MECLVNKGLNGVHDEQGGESGIGIELRQKHSKVNNDKCACCADCDE